MASEPTERDDQLGGWRRLRSGALLALLLAGIGVTIAAIVGVVALATAALVDQTLG
jgi:hypothetical protein